MSVDMEGGTSKRKSRVRRPAPWLRDRSRPGGHALGVLDFLSIEEEILDKVRVVARALFSFLFLRLGLLLVYGNGPQVGIEFLRCEMARVRVPPFHLDVLVAQTQGSMGYVLAALRRSVGGN
jgi:carbamate kinase